MLRRHCSTRWITPYLDGVMTRSLTATKSTQHGVRWKPPFVRARAACNGKVYPCHHEHLGRLPPAIRPGSSACLCILSRTLHLRTPKRKVADGGVIETPTSGPRRSGDTVALPFELPILAGWHAVISQLTVRALTAAWPVVPRGFEPPTPGVIRAGPLPLRIQDVQCFPESVLVKRANSTPVFDSKPRSG